MERNVLGGGEQPRVERLAIEQNGNALLDAVQN